MGGKKDWSPHVQNPTPLASMYCIERLNFTLSLTFSLSLWPKACTQTLTHSLTRTRSHSIALSLSHRCPKASFESENFACFCVDYIKVWEAIKCVCEWVCASVCVCVCVRVRVSVSVCEWESVWKREGKREIDVVLQIQHPEKRK